MQEYIVELLVLCLISFLIGRFMAEKSTEDKSFFHNPEPDTLNVKIIRDQGKISAIEFIKKGVIDLNYKVYGVNTKAIFETATRQLKAVVDEIERASKT